MDVHVDTEKAAQSAIPVEDLPRTEVFDAATYQAATALLYDMTSMMHIFQPVLLAVIQRGAVSMLRKLLLLVLYEPEWVAALARERHEDAVKVAVERGVDRDRFEEALSGASRRLVAGVEVVARSLRHDHEQCADGECAADEDVGRALAEELARTLGPAAVILKDL